MEFFAPCWIALQFIFSEAPSKSYFDKVSRTFTSRMHVCNQVGIAAAKRGYDPILFIAIALNETNFTYTPSKKGAKGPLGVIPTYHCPKKGKCDYIHAGIDAYAKAETFTKSDDLCTVLAVYNRGPKGLCKEGRSEYGYAQVVIRRYEEICEKSDSCTPC
jgi:hypothetical protein